MKFSIGDKITLNRGGEEGHVTAIINNEMVEVDVNGTVFPAYIDDIDHPYLKWFTTKKVQKQTQHEQIPVEKVKTPIIKLSKGVYLSFIPVYKIVALEDIVDYLKVYLLNELPINIKFSYDVRLSNQSEFAHEGEIQSFSNIYLNNVPYEDMNDQPRFHWKLQDIANPKNEIEEGILRIKPSKLFEQINNLQIKNEPSFCYQLITAFKLKQKPEPKERFIPTIKVETITLTVRNIEAGKHEIDLHIEALLPNTRGLSNSEILKIQLDTLHKYIQLSIVHRQERLIVIHGLGKGVLREEVHKILKQTKEVVRFKNEYSARYGFGATEVWFKY